MVTSSDTSIMQVSYNRYKIAMMNIEDENIKQEES